MQKQFPSLVGMRIGPNDACDQLFTAFDLDGDKTIDFKELTIGVAKLVSGTKEEKMELMFELCDADNSGTGNLLTLWRRLVLDGH